MADSFYDFPIPSRAGWGDQAVELGSHLLFFTNISPTATYVLDIDPATDTYVEHPITYYNSTASILAANGLIYRPGNGTGATQVVNPSTWTTTTVASSLAFNWRHSAVVGNKLVVVSSTANQFGVIDTTTDTLTPTTATARAFTSATAAPNGLVYAIANGWCRVINPATGGYSDLAIPARGWTTKALLVGNDLWVFGHLLSYGLKLDTSTHTYTEFAMPNRQRGCQAQVGPSGNIYSPSTGTPAGICDVINPSTLAIVNSFPVTTNGRPVSLRASNGKIYCPNPSTTTCEVIWPSTGGPYLGLRA